MASVIMIAGPVGAGKSAVARELVAGWTGPLVYIEGDCFWPFIARELPEQSRPQRFRMTMASMTAACVPYVRAGYDVLLDFSIPPWFLDTARAIISAKGFALEYVALRPELAVCAARVAGREAGRIADYGPYRALYESFDVAAARMVADGPVDEMATAIRAGLAIGQFRVA